MEEKKNEVAELTVEDLHDAQGGLASTDGGHPVAAHKSRLLPPGDVGVGIGSPGDTG